MLPDKSQDYCSNQIISVLREHTVCCSRKHTHGISESPSRAKHFQTRHTFLSNAAEARSLHHRNNSSSQRFRNPASQPEKSKADFQPGLQGSCQRKCIDPSYLYLLVWYSLDLGWSIIQATRHKDSRGNPEGCNPFYKNPSGLGPTPLYQYKPTNVC